MKNLQTLTLIPTELLDKLVDDLDAIKTRLDRISPTTESEFFDYIPRNVVEKQFAIGKATWHRLVNDGIFTVYKLKGKQYLKKSQLMEVLENGRI